MTISASVAQSVERTALNRTVAGSSLAGGLYCVTPNICGDLIISDILVPKAIYTLSYVRSLEWGEPIKHTARISMYSYLVMFRGFVETHKTYKCKWVQISVQLKHWLNTLHKESSKEIHSNKAFYITQTLSQGLVILQVLYSTLFWDRASEPIWPLYHLSKVHYEWLSISLVCMCVGLHWVWLQVACYLVLSATSIPLDKRHYALVNTNSRCIAHLFWLLRNMLACIMPHSY